MKVKVEFYGLASRLCGKKEADLLLEDGATLEDILEELSLKFPELVGPIMGTNKRLLPDYVISVNGRYIPESLKSRVYDGECLLLMPLLGGG